MEDMKELINFSLINIDKPTGPTSFTISDYVRKRLEISKASHMGTLDPKVTGVLPITLGRACKLAAYFIRHDKTYVGILHTHKEQDMKELQKLINEKFVGKIKQTPPNRSAVKREEREREVYFWNLIEMFREDTCTGVPFLGDSSNLDVNTGKDFLFECKVEGGTYIRKLCSDLGEIIGGAHMDELRRTEAGIFDETTLVTMTEFDSAVDKMKNGDEKPFRAMLVRAEDAIRKVLPVGEVREKAIEGLHKGRPLLKKDVLTAPKLKTGEVFALFCKERFIGVYNKVGDGEVFGKAEFVYT
jgi:H/ACA ribonucleoprotein complex subunit 4